jgi:predicted alpha/beta hydrolase family esterase
LIRLEEAVLTAPQVVVVAHDLGCIQLAAWAAHSRYTERVQAALLVSPLDVESLEMRERLSTWSPISRQRLPFKSGVIGTASGTVDASQPAQVAAYQALAACWGAQWMGILAPPTPADQPSAVWPQGQALLHELLKD